MCEVDDLIEPRSQQIMLATVVSRRWLHRCSLTARQQTNDLLGQQSSLKNVQQFVQHRTIALLEKGIVSLDNLA